MTSLAKMLASADQLSLSEQEALVETLSRRVAEQRRAELLATVEEARAEYAAGHCQPASPAKIFEKIAL